MARHGLPKNAWKNRTVKKECQVVTVAASILRQTNATNVEAYIRLLPIYATSLRGAHIIGPKPSRRQISPKYKIPSIEETDKRERRVTSLVAIAVR
jgi:hypothetical protein